MWHPLWLFTLSVASLKTQALAKVVSGWLFNYYAPGQWAFQEEVLEKQIAGGGIWSVGGIWDFEMGSASSACVGLELKKQKPALNHFLLIARRLSDFFFFFFWRESTLQQIIILFWISELSLFRSTLPPLTDFVLTTRPSHKQGRDFSGLSHPPPPQKKSFIWWRVEESRGRLRGVVLSSLAVLKYIADGAESSVPRSYGRLGF